MAVGNAADPLDITEEDLGTLENQSEVKEVLKEHNTKKEMLDKLDKLAAEMKAKEEKLANFKKINIIVGLIIGLPAWVIAFWWNWKIALLLFFILWSEKLLK